MFMFQYVSKSVTNQYNPNSGSLIKSIEVTKENYDDYGNPGKITLDKYKYNGFFGVSHHRSESVFQYVPVYPSDASLCSFQLQQLSE